MRARPSVVISVVCGAVLFFGALWWAHTARQHAKATQALLQELVSADRPVRAAAREKLVATHDAAAIEGLIKLLDTEGPVGGREVIVALVDIGEPAVEPLLDALPHEEPEWLKIIPQGLPIPTPEASEAKPGAATVLVTMGKTALPVIQNALEHGKTMRRTYAAIMLGRIGDASSVPALTKALSDPEPEVRSAAVSALSQIDDPAASEALFAAPADGNINVRLAMVSALRHCGKSAAEPLEKLTRDFSGSVRAAAMAALVAVDEKKAAEVAETVITDRDATVRAEAAIAMATANPAKSLDVLIEALTSPDESIEVRAAYALGDIKDPKAIEPLIAAATANQSPARRGVFASLKAFADPRCVPACIAAFNDPDARVRKNAVSTLEYMHDERARKPLIELFKTEKERSVRSMIIYVLGRYEDPEVVSLMIAAYRDKTADSTIRGAIADVLSISKDPAAKQFMIDALADRAPDVRKMSLACLRNFPNPDAFDAISALTSDPDVKVRTELTMTLGYSKDPRAVEPLVKLLRQDSDMVVRANAARGLSLLKDERSVAPLIEALNDPAGVKDGVPITAAYALLTIGGDEAIAAVDEAVKGYDIPEMTAGYTEYIRKSDSKYIVPLTVALVRSGDMKMAEDLFWSDHAGLSGNAEWWAQSVGRRKELLASQDSLSRPKWQWKEEKKPEGSAWAAKRLAEIKNPDAKKRERAARSIGSILDILAPREGASVFDTRKGVVIKSVEAPGFGMSVPVGSDMMLEMNDEMDQDLRSETTSEQKMALVDALIAAVKDTDAGVRASAARCLGYANDPIVLDALAGAIKDPDPRVRRQAAVALRRIRDPRSALLLTSALKDSDNTVRSMVIWALSRLRDPAAIQPLIEMLKHPAPGTRRQAAVALGYFGDTRAIAPLKMTLKESEPVVIAASAIGLLKIGGKEAVAAVDERADGISVDEAAKGYKTLIAAGSDTSVVPLILALAKHGDVEMGTIYYWSGNKALLDVAQVWSEVFSEDNAQTYAPVDEEEDSPDYPKWPGGTPPSSEDVPAESSAAQ